MVWSYVLQKRFVFPGTLTSSASWYTLTHISQTHHATAPISTMTYQHTIADLFGDSYGADGIDRYPIFVLNYNPSKIPSGIPPVYPEAEVMAFEALSRIQRALENQNQLEIQHQRLLTSIECKNIEVETFRAAFTEHDQRSRGFLLSCLEAFPRTMAPTATSAAKAARVFGIPELFEMILSYLCADDILAVTQINRRSSDIFKNSSALQRRGMQLLSNKGALFHPWLRVPEEGRTRFTMPCVSQNIDGEGGSMKSH